MLAGGEIIELSSDLGGGKTTLAQGIAKGLGYTGDIISPTFTVSRVYRLPKGKELYHFDFYRLAPDDVTSLELAEAAGQPDKIVLIEWAGQVGSRLPEDRMTVTIEATGETERQFTFSGGDRYQQIIEGLKS